MTSAVVLPVLFLGSALIPRPIEDEDREDTYYTLRCASVRLVVSFLLTELDSPSFPTFVDIFLQSKEAADVHLIARTLHLLTSFKILTDWTGHVMPPKGATATEPVKVFHDCMAAKAALRGWFLFLQQEYLQRRWWPTRYVFDWASD